MRTIHKLIIKDIIQSHDLYYSPPNRLQYLTSKDTIESTIKKELKFNYQGKEIYIHQEIILPSNPKQNHGGFSRPYQRYTYCSYKLKLIITNIHLNKKQTFKYDSAIKSLKLLIEEVEIHHENCEVTK
jgi:hypothetical protein